MLVIATSIGGATVLSAPPPAGGDETPPESAGAVAAYAGIYREGPVDADVTVYTVDGQLLADAPGKGTFHLERKGEHTFSVRELPGVQLVFDVDAGRATQVTVKTPDEDAVRRRVNARKAGDHRHEERTLMTADGDEIRATFGRFVVPENRANPEARLIELAYVRLHGTPEQSTAPLVYLAGGPGDSSTRFANSPGSLSAWLPTLSICDVVFVDQRGTGASEPVMGWQGDPPPSNVARDVGSAARFAIANAEQAAAHLRAKGIDFDGYTTIESADDLRDLAGILGAPRISLIGFSYGTHLAQATIRRHPALLENVVICGVEGLDQTYKLPLNADTQFRKLALYARHDEALCKHVPDLEALFRRVLEQLEREPMVVEVAHQPSGNRIPIEVGKFGLQMILRFDLGDASDLPVFPLLLHSIAEGDSSILQWFVQKRVGVLGGVSGMSMLTDAASGASPERLAMIASQAPESLFGNVMNFPFLAPGYLDVWKPADLGEAFRAPLVSDVRTLFLTGTLDWNTPPHQAEEVRWGFSNGTHLIVENAGHEQILWQPAIREAVRRFLKGEDVSDVKVSLPPIRFVPIRGYDPAATHPSADPQRRFDALAVDRGDTAAAMAFGREFLEAARDHALPLNQFAWALVSEEKYGGRFNKLALAMAERAVELTDHKNWMYLDTLAHAQFATGDVEQAVATGRKAVERAGDDPRAGEAKATLAKFESAMKQDAK